MIEREDFYQILTHTLNEYYLDVHKINVDVKVESIKTNILVFETLGSIHMRYPSREIYKYWMSEYNIRDNYVKYILAKIYVISCFLLKDILAQKYISMDNAFFDRNIAIIPANRKIRIFNFKDKYVDAIVKYGFTRKYFLNELEFRLSTNYDFVPKILEYGDTWYREKILTGMPLARVKNKKLYDSSINVVKQYLMQIHNDTSSEVEFTSYKNQLISRIVNKLKIAKEKKSIVYYDEMIDFVEKINQELDFYTGKITIVLSHGDLQTGNIWYNDGNIYIIDWETHDFRSKWYDLFVLLFSLRRSKKISELFNSVKKNGSIIIEDNDNIAPLIKIGLVFLEDIEFYLDDMLELPMGYGSKIFDRISQEFLCLEW